MGAGGEAERRKEEEGERRPLGALPGGDSSSRCRRTRQGREGGWRWGQEPFGRRVVSLRTVAGTRDTGPQCVTEFV